MRLCALNKRATVTWDADNGALDKVVGKEEGSGGDDGGHAVEDDSVDRQLLANGAGGLDHDRGIGGQGDVRVAVRQVDLTVDSVLKGENEAVKIPG